MPVIKSYPFSSDFGDSQLGVQANGIASDGGSMPNGIPNRLFVNSGYMTATLVEGDPITAAGHRSEIYLQPETVPGEYWYTWDFMVPSSWNFDKIMVIMQIHDTPDNGDNPRFPNFAIGLESGQLVSMVSSGSLPTENAVANRLAQKSLDFDVWHTACLHVKWAANNTGFREFFVDRYPMMRQFNVGTAYSDVVGPYLKLGVYDFFSQSSIGTKTACFRNLKVWSGNDGYQSVMGGTPRIPSRCQLL